jgi:hypothetical protein
VWGILLVQVAGLLQYRRSPEPPDPNCSPPCPVWAGRSSWTS